MKRTAALVIALLLFAISGCAGSEPVATTAPTTSAPTSSSTTSSTTAPTQPTTTQITTQPTQPTTEPHVHTYKSSVLKKANCTQEGTKKFTCSCGDSFTEPIKAKGHTWGKWLQIVAGNTLDPTGTYRVCSVCKAEERSVNYSSMLKKYVALAGWLNRTYTSPSQITAEEAAKALPMILTVLPEFGDDPAIATRTYPIADLNACAVKCFGTAFDFSGVKDIDMFGYGTISYDVQQDALIWTFPYGQDLSWHKTVFDKYASNNDNTKFSVKFHYEYQDGTSSDTFTLTVELKNGNYVITSIAQ